MFFLKQRKFQSSNMKKNIFLVVLSLCAVLSSTLAQNTIDPVIQKSITAMGTAKLNSIQYSGTGKWGVLGQSHAAGMAWPILIIKSDIIGIDYTNMVSNEVMVRVYDNPPAKGGGAPFLSEARITNTLRSFPASADSIEERHLQLLITAHGFLKQATMNKTSVKKIKNGNEVSFNAGKYK